MRFSRSVAHSTALLLSLVVRRLLLDGERLYFYRMRYEKMKAIVIDAYGNADLVNYELWRMK